MKYPKETFDLLLNDNNIKDQQWNRFTIYILKHKDGLPFRTAVQNKCPRLIQLILINSEQSTSMQNIFTSEERYEVQRQAILIVHTLTEFDNQFTSIHPEIINSLKSIWKTDLYKV